MSVIGDAAHAGLPNGQGLNLAIEDGESNPSGICASHLKATDYIAGNARDTSCSMKGPQAQSSLLRAGAVLGWHFRENGVSAEALRGFNAERGPRVKEVYTKVWIAGCSLCSVFASCYCGNRLFSQGSCLISKEVSFLMTTSLPSCLPQTLMLQHNKFQQYIQTQKFFYICCRAWMLTGELRRRG